MSWLAAALVGAAAGVLSGFGVGGGTLLLLWLTQVQGMGQLQAGGVNLLYFGSCALPALWGHFRNGLVEKKALVWCVLLGAPACALGALLAARLDTSLPAQNLWDIPLGGGPAGAVLQGGRLPGA